MTDAEVRDTDENLRKKLENAVKIYPFTMDDLNRMLTKEHVRYRMRMRYLEQRLRWRLFL